jgi:sugar lactone lactonase YvrE
MADLQTLVDGRALLEGPRWHDGALYLSDIHAHEVLRVTTDGAVEVFARLDTAPSGLGWLPDGDMLIVSMEDRKLLRRADDGVLTEHADLSHLAAHRINDMLVTAAGHAYVTQFGCDLWAGEPPAPAVLMRVDPDGSVHAVADDLRFGNGMVVTADGTTLVVAESAGGCLTAFTLAADGTLSDRRCWADLGDIPDGICIDAEDAVWFASPASDHFVRVRKGGEVTDVIETPGRHAIACALGGEDGRTLFCCTAPTFGDPEQSQSLRTAKIEVVEL